MDLENPRPKDIDIHDIACGLSKICRFTGQLPQFYSVAQHAMLVAEVIEPRLRFPALNHDDSEAYLGDLTRNLKHSRYLAGYRTLERRWTAAINQALGIGRLVEADRRQLKAADDLAAVWERTVLREGRPWEAWSCIETAVEQGWVRSNFLIMLALAEQIPSAVYLRGHYDAEQVFLDRFEQYQ